MTIFAQCMSYLPSPDDTAAAELDYRMGMICAKAAAPGAAHTIVTQTDDWLEWCRVYQAA